MAGNKPTREAVMIDRELSPDSLKFVAPPAPRGTKRRPAKPLTVPPTSGGQSSPQGEFDTVACIAHVKGLDPKLNDKPLDDLNLAWLSTSDMALPLSADARIYIHMHKYDTYSLEGAESKALALVKFLRKGTEIEQLDSSMYKVLESRVSARAKVLADTLLRDGFIEKSNGELTKSKGFLQVWKFNKSYWKEEKPGLATRCSPEEDESIGGGIYDDFDTPPRAMKRPRLSTTNPNHRSAHMNNNTADIANAGRSFRVPNRTEPGISRQPGIITRPTSVPQEEEITSIAVASRHSSTDMPLMEDGTDGIKHAFDFLDTNVSDSRPATPVILAPRETTLVPREVTPSPRAATSAPQDYLSHPMTPTSPAPSVATLAHEKGPSMTPGLHFESPSRQGVPPTSQMLTPTPSPLKEVHFHINFLSAAGNYDPSVSIRRPRLPLSSLQAFFKLVADRSGVPLDTFHCLTLQYTFYGLNTVVVQKDATEAEWNRIKYDIQLLYEFTRQKVPEKRAFGIWVDPGDTKTVKPNDDDLYDES